MPFKGWWGGFFKDLGTAGGAMVLLSAVGGAFVHSYISIKWAAAAGTEPGDPKQELKTFGVMAIPALVYGVLHAMGKIPDNDAANIVGNMCGGILVWETANLAETLVTILEGEGGFASLT